MNVTPLNVLAVDDDRALLNSLVRILKHEPIRLLPASDPYQAIPLIQNHDIQLVLLDLRMPGMDGIGLLQRIKEQHPDLPVIMLTGHGNIQEAVKAVKLGADDFLEKPCPPATLVQKIQAYYPHQAAPRATAKFDFPALIGASTVMRQLKKTIGRVAGTQATILLHGETGVGKELVARAIHHHSPRSKEVFVPVDCATISAEILESELFGHRRGAFTGADHDKEGLFLSADRGTLFLDEIGEFQFELQAKLLRVLQERQVRPVGSNTASAINIRLIAATNKDLALGTEQGTFRSDLYYRLAAIEVEIPALRERREDIPQLAAYFLRRHAQSTDYRFTAAALERLERYDWPGNVRELENTVIRAVALCEGNTIADKDLPARINNGKPAGTIIPPLADLEKSVLKTALSRTATRRQAAEYLHISEATLYRKLKKAGLSKTKG